jgi:hypothetical protein
VSAFSPLELSIGFQPVSLSAFQFFSKKVLTPSLNPEIVALHTATNNKK